MTGEPVTIDLADGKLIIKDVGDDGRVQVTITTTADLAKLLAILRCATAIDLDIGPAE